MRYASFCHAMFQQMHASPKLVLTSGSRIVIMSDFHAGNGSRKDDLTENGQLLLALLEHYYLPRGATLVLNGDIEELQKFSFETIHHTWASLFSLFDRFNAEDRLYKIAGNHDEKIFDIPGYPYKVHEGLRLLTGGKELYVLHGHQASHYYTNYNHLIGGLVKYVVRTVGLRSMNVSKNSRRKFKIERRLYRFCQDYKRVAIIGHTHRPLFESMSKYDFLRFSIEGLCRDYPLADEARRGEIAATLADYKEEFGRLKRREKRRAASAMLYGSDIIMPCLFNAGCAVGRKGITAIEIEDGKIELVYWFEHGKMRRYLYREFKNATALEGTPYLRAVINSDRLDYLLARIELLS
ncbi:MAG: metallophosphoesterase family protein [Spirochaetota bacterium]